MNYVFSELKKTWVIDLDGTIVKHNGYRLGKEELLEGALEFFNKIPNEDLIIILTARGNQYQQDTIDFLQSKGIRFDHIIFDVPHGERILINDKKPSGLGMAYAINKIRDEKLEVNFEIDKEL